MCFSSGASFGASAILTVIGIASIKKVQDPIQYIFASIPLIFALQQLSEGIVWLSLSQPENSAWQKPATYTFLFFAQVVWPSCVPISVWILEKDKRRKKILLFFSGTGLVVSTYLAYCLFTHPNNSEIAGQHIYYSLNYPPKLREYGSVFYFLATVIPPMFSSVKKMWVIGLAILVSYIFTRLFLAEFTISVWCFFAAIISSVVYAIMHDVQLYFNSAASVIRDTR